MQTLCIRTFLNQIYIFIRFPFVLRQHRFAKFPTKIKSTKISWLTTYLLNFPFSPLMKSCIFSSKRFFLIRSVSTTFSLFFRHSRRFLYSLRNKWQTKQLNTIYNHINNCYNLLCNCRIREINGTK